MGLGSGVWPSSEYHSATLYGFIPGQEKEGFIFGDLHSAALLALLDIRNHLIPLWGPSLQQTLNQSVQ